MALPIAQQTGAPPVRTSGAAAGPSTGNTVDDRSIADMRKISLTELDEAIDPIFASVD
jgi:hypothetical protein